MTPEDVSALRDVAADVARAAGEELLRRQGGSLEVAHKSSDTDPVSEADRAVESLVERMLADARPDDGLMGEEGARRPSASGLRWVVDPLDGTVNYLYGFPAWCVSVACERRSSPDAAGQDGPAWEGDGWQTLVGVVFDPLRDELFSAVRGQGARVDGRLLRVNDPVALERALIATGFGYDAELRRAQAAVAARLLPLVRDIRRAGSAALDLCWLAAGRVDGYYEENVRRWDWAAGALVAAEAGARVGRLPGGGILAAGPALHDVLARCLAESGT